MSGDAVTTAHGTRRRRPRRATVVVTVALLAAVAVAVLAADRPATSTPLDPDNPGADGARALARVLDDQGVDVRVVRGADELERQRLDASTTVLVTSTDLLGRSTVQRMVDALAGADLVLAEPDNGVVTALGLEVASWRLSGADAVPARCPDPVLSGLELSADSATEYGTATGCFPGEHGQLVARPRDGLTFLGASRLITNDQILRADNAAVALRLLGQRDHLVWYVPDPTDLIGGDGVSLRTLAPDFVQPGLWILGATVVALMLWRARRLGPLVVEPLPVTVKAIETARSRGRLYRKAGDRRHAARALRSATRTSLAARLHLPPPSAATEEALVQAVARHTGRPADQVRGLLSSDVLSPATDDDLIRLGNDLAALEREVRR